MAVSGCIPRFELRGTTKAYEAATLVLQNHAAYGHYRQSPDIPDIPDIVKSHFLGNPHSILHVYSNLCLTGYGHGDGMYNPESNSNSPPFRAVKGCRGRSMLIMALCVARRFRWHRHISFDSCLVLVRDRKINLNVTRHMVLVSHSVGVSPNASLISKPSISQAPSPLGNSASDAGHNLVTIRRMG